MAKEIPVYLFVGFLESGKTRFIQKTMEDERFSGDERTLLLCCEQGEEDYTPDTFVSSKVNLVNIDSVEELTEDNLNALIKRFKSDRLVVEYNGMWMLSDLYAALPEDCVIYQQFTFVDCTTFTVYNNNMRNLMVDKLRDCELAVFNRFTDSTDKMEIHKVVRAANRMCDIAYEYENGEAELDDIEDPPPYDINAPIVKIEDKDYAWWYRDISEDPAAFNGKTVEFSSLALLDNKSMGNSTYLVGRQLMNCCEADTNFAGFVAQQPLTMNKPTHKGWYNVVAKIDYRFHKVYGQKGPVLNVTSLTPIDELEEPVATFY